MKDVSILMVIGGVLTLIYINRNNIRLDFTFQFKAGDESNKKASLGKGNAETEATKVTGGGNSTDGDMDQKHDGSPAIPVNLAAETSVFGQSKTVFERRNESVPQGLILPNPVSNLAPEPNETGTESGDDETEENEEEGDEDLEVDGVHENPHYSLQEQLGNLKEVPPMPDVHLDFDDSDFFRLRPGDDDDVEFNEVGLLAPEPIIVDGANPTDETGISVATYWNRIEEVHRHAQALNRLFLRRQRKKDLEQLTTQFLTVLTKLEMRSDANVGWFLEDFLEQLTPISLANDPAQTEPVGMASKASTDEPYAIFGNIEVPTDEYRDLWAHLNRLAAQSESTDSVSAVPTEDDPYS